MFFNTPKALWAGRADCGCFEMHVGGKLFNLTFLQKRRNDKWLPDCFQISQMATRWFRNQSQIFTTCFKFDCQKLSRRFQNVFKMKFVDELVSQKTTKIMQKRRQGPYNHQVVSKLTSKWLSNIPKLSSNTKWLPNRYPGSSKRCSKSRFLIKMSS